MKKLFTLAASFMLIAMVISGCGEKTEEKPESLYYPTEAAQTEETKIVTGMGPGETVVIGGTEPTEPRPESENIFWDKLPGGKYEGRFTAPTPETKQLDQDHQPEGMAGYESWISEMAVSMPDDSTIWREPVLDPSDPEYIDDLCGKYGNPDWTPEGKIYANDRKVSITIPAKGDKTEDVTITFGAITGEYNQYLYLNPSCDLATTKRPFGYYVKGKTSGGNRVFSRGLLLDCGETGPVSGLEPLEEMEPYRQLGPRPVNFYIPGQTFDQLKVASFTDYYDPGLMWFSTTPLKDEYAELYCRVVDMGRCTLVALIKICIAQNPANGTYYIHHLENMDLMVKGYTNTTYYDEIDPEMWAEAIELTKQAIDEGEFYPEYKSREDLDEQFMFVDYLDESRGFYFQHGRPLFTGDFDYKSLAMKRIPLPALAVTFSNGHYRGGPNTVYICLLGRGVQRMAMDFPYPDSHFWCLDRQSMDTALDPWQ